jgi:hypothetical protein
MNGKETVLWSFKGKTEGVQPYAGIIRDAAGNLYGTTGGGASAHHGFSGAGVVFKVTP